MAGWRILTWNVHGSARPDLDRIAAVLADQRADVVALQEIRSRQARRLAERLGWSVRWARKHYPFTPLLWWLAEGAAILSPHALSSSRRVSLTPGVSSWTFRHRIVLVATARRGAGGGLRCYNVHLSTADHHERIRQAKQIELLIVADPDRDVPRVVAGDLNDPDPVDVLAEFATDGFVDRSEHPTSPAGEPSQRIDYVLVPRRMVQRDGWTAPGGQAWSALSDHLPTAVTVDVAD